MANVQLPDGSVIAFPDGMPDGAINTAITQHLSAQPSNSLENYANAIGQGETNTGTAILGLGADAANKMGMASDESTQAFKDLAQKAREDYANKNPVQAGVGKFAADILTNPVSFVPGGPAAVAAASGASSALINSPANQELSDKVLNTATGGTVGAITGKILGSLLGGIKSSLTPEQERLASVLQDNGVDLTPAQATGNKTMKLMESTFKNLPITSTVQGNIEGDQAKAFTKAVLEKAGVNSEAATPDIINNGYKNAGNMIGQITEKHTMPIDNQFIQDVLDTQGEYGQTIAPAERPQFNEWVNKITSGNSMPGHLYQQTRSGLGKIADSAWNRDPTFAKAVDALQSNMDDAMQRGMLANGAADDAAALAENRGYYGNMKTVMRAMNSGSQDALSGNIPPTRLGAALRAGNPTGYVTGQGPLNDLSRAGEAFLKDSIGDSGTAGRTKMADIMQGHWGVPIGAGGAAYAAGGAPLAAASGVATIGLPVAIQQLYNRFPQYMAHGVPIAGSPLALKLGALLAGNKEGQFISEGKLMQ